MSALVLTAALFDPVPIETMTNAERAARPEKASDRRDDDNGGTK